MSTQSQGAEYPLEFLSGGAPDAGSKCVTYAVVKSCRGSTTSI